MTVAQMKAARAAKLKSARDLLAAAKAANREVTADEATQAQTLVDEAAALATKIAAATAVDALSASIDADIAGLDDVPAPRTGKSATRIESTTDLAAEDPKRGFKSPRDFMASVLKAGQTNGRSIDKRLQPLIVRKEAAAGSDEQGEYSQPYGGFTVPDGFAPSLLSVQAEGDPTAGRTMRVPMSTPVLNINARVDKNHTTSVTGGLTFSRRAEADTSGSSRTEYERVKLEATSLMGKAFATEELLTDSPISFVAIIEAGFREQYGSHILNEKIRGTGVGEYLGVLNSPCKVDIAKENNQTANTIVYANLLKMRARCWGYGQAIWLANQDIIPQLGLLNVATGTGGLPVYMPSAREDMPDMLFGRPIFYSEYPETLGTSGDLILSNWSQYLEGDLQGLQSAESMHVRFEQNERCFRVTARNDGRPWWRSALTPKKGAGTLSPIVTLATRA